MIRLNNGNGEQIGPGEFIPVAERDDLILRIDDYVLRRALREFKPIVERKQEIVVSVNVLSTLNTPSNGDSKLLKLPINDEPEIFSTVPEEYIADPLLPPDALFEEFPTNNESVTVNSPVEYILAPLAV